MEAPLIGVDLVEPERLKDRLRELCELREIFTEAETAFCTSQLHPEEHLAARFCAKEAVVKALGIDGFDPTEIEVVGGGADVRLRLHGHALERARELDVHVTISMSHLPSMACAVALALPSPIRGQPIRHFIPPS